MNTEQETQKHEQIVRVTISEAARLFGINPRTIRRAIKRQELRYIVVKNRYKISFGSLVGWSQQHTEIKHKRDQRGIGQWINQWKIRNTLYSPRPPHERTNANVGKRPSDASAS